MITREWILKKIEDFRRAEMEHLALANANHGALEAYNVLLAQMNQGDAPAIPLEKLIAVGEEKTPPPGGTNG